MENKALNNRLIIISIFVFLFFSAITLKLVNVQIINKDKVQEIVDTKGASYKTPWFGQLMTGPQMIAYLIQVDTWLRDYNVNILI